jgi:hypothetical protein
MCARHEAALSTVSESCPVADSGLLGDRRRFGRSAARKISVEWTVQGPDSVGGRGVGEADGTANGEHDVGVSFWIEHRRG